METKMKVRTLDHVNIRTDCLDETVAFYTNFLGMSCRPPPGMKEGGRGAWIYDGDDRPVIHVGTFGARYPGEAEHGGLEPVTGSGAIHHVALECLGYDELLGRFKDANFEVVTSNIPSIDLRQIFVKDPNGVTLELNFRGAAS
jgi:catechol 2,3-dioxygenase-like lactoylglutathione lyase family enzyme